MLSVTAVISTYCFVESPNGLAQVVWLDLESSDDDEVEAWVEGAEYLVPGPLERPAQRRRTAAGGSCGARPSGG